MACVDSTYISSARLSVCSQLTSWVLAKRTVGVSLSASGFPLRKRGVSRAINSRAALAALRGPASKLGYARTRPRICLSVAGSQSVSVCDRRHTDRQTNRQTDHARIYLSQ